jgi:hypothetical protein
MKNRERGQALIMVTFSIAFLLGMIGLAVDLGWSYYRIQAAQAAAESAALAASVAVLQNATITCGNSICQAALPCAANPTAPPADNIASGCLYAKANGFVNTGQQTVQIAANLTNPPTATGISTLYWVTATVTERNVQLFSGLFGNHTFGSVAAQATAGVFQGTTPNCIYVMDRTASQALMLSGSNSIIQTNCGVYVNSNSASAVVVNGQGKLNAPTVNIVGSYQSCTNGQDCFFNPSLPRTYQSSVTEPYFNLPAPSYTACDRSASQLQFGQGTPANLNPGSYCGGIAITGSAQVTLNPGVYIMSGGGLQINSANSRITGSGVMIYNTSGPVAYGPVLFTGQSTANLSAPTSGTYSGVLFYQDRNLTSSSANQIEATTNPHLIGSLYFPTTPLVLTGGSGPTPFAGIVVARTLTVNGGGNGAFIAPTGTANGTATAVKYSALIQ